jgi:phospholipid transport system transporter-binding protein
VNIITTAQGLKLGGDLVYSSVSAVDKTAKILLEKHQSQQISIDCKMMTKLDSAGIALLVDWKRWCDNHKKQFQLENVNEKAMALISSYKLNKILKVSI